MIDSTDMKRFAAALGLDCAGVAPADLPRPPYAEEPPCPLAAGVGDERYEPRRILPSCRSVIVVLVPYYTAQTEQANLSLYCRSADYHAVVRAYLEQIAAYLQRQYPGSEQRCVVDTSPLSDRWLAYQAGLGFFGDNRCLINDTYGLLRLYRQRPHVPALHAGPAPATGMLSLRRLSVSLSGTMFFRRRLRLQLLQIVYYAKKRQPYAARNTMYGKNAAHLRLRRMSGIVSPQRRRQSNAPSGILSEPPVTALPFGYRVAVQQTVPTGLRRPCLRLARQKGAAPQSGIRG